MQSQSFCHYCLTTSSISSYVINLRKWSSRNKNTYLLPFRKLLIFYRVIANILVLIVLGSSAYAINTAVERSKKFEKDKEKGIEISWWETNEVRYHSLTQNPISKIKKHFKIFQRKSDAKSIWKYVFIGHHCDVIDHSSVSKYIWLYWHHGKVSSTYQFKISTCKVSMGNTAY